MKKNSQELASPEPRRLNEQHLLKYAPPTLKFGGWGVRGEGREKKKQTNLKRTAHAKGAPKAFVKTNGWIHLLEPSRPNLIYEAKAQWKQEPNDTNKLHV